MSLTLRTRLRRGGVLFALCLLGVCGRTGLTGQTPMKSLDKVTLDYYRGPGAPKPIPGYEHHYAYLIDSVSVKGNKRWVGLVRVSSPQHGSILFPTLRRGEIVPMFGALYRVELPGNLLVRLKAEDVPKGIGVEKDSFVIPLRREEAGSGQITYRTAKDQYIGKTVFVTSILPAEGKDGQPVAHIKIDDIRNKAQPIRRGDELKLGETTWIVRSVVPRDSDRQLLGWVELGRK
ncbi:MAG: hypothetical protein L0Z62_01690 [Gemmataceae bacterium]|nr:hypothetical protein [Gemmataceae bacterium]